MLHNFFQAISWNILNVFLYKIILQIHQACLFYVVSQYLFGLSGTIFSYVYFLISITNFGFDYFLIMYHQAYTTSKQNFNKLIPLCFLRILISCAVVIALYTLYSLTAYHPPHNLTDNLDIYLLAALIIVFIFEGLKKSLDIIAQMSFLQKSITVFDISTLLLYISGVWTWFWLTGSITLYSIFIPMSAIAIIECCLVIHRLYSMYQKLPDTHQAFITPHKTSILKNQVFNYINQITKALFSPNFFIVLLSYHLGFKAAGYIKLFTDIIILLYMLLNRSLGMPSAAIFATITQVDQPITPLQKNIFLKIINSYIQCTYVAISIVLSIMTPYLYSSSDSNVIIINLFAFIACAFIEYIFITYEKWFLTQQKAWLLSYINLICLIPYSLVLFFIHYIPSKFILLPIVIIRCISLIITMIVTHQRWSLIPSFKIHRYTLLACALFVSVILSWHCLYQHN